MRRLFLALATGAAAAAAAGVGTPAALADDSGGCQVGGNLSIATACPIIGSFGGTLTTNNPADSNWPNGGETDFYKFYATKGTVLSVTVTDDYACNLPPVQSVAGPWSPDGQCGVMLTQMDLSDNNTVVGTESGWGIGGDSNVNYTLHSGTMNAGPLDGSGIWVLEVDGSPAYRQNADNTLTVFPTPYSVNVSATAGSIQWPPPGTTDDSPPPPPNTTTPPTSTPSTPAAPVHHPAAVVRCVVPSVSGQTLSTVKHRLAANHCTVGRVQWFTKVPHGFGRPRHGNVFALVSGTRKVMKAGAVLPKGTKLGLWAVGPATAQTRSR